MVCYVSDHTTEVWARNPSSYIKEVVESGLTRSAWDFGHLRKKSIDPQRFLNLYYGTATPWRALVIGEQGTLEVGPRHPIDSPLATYPTWEYGGNAADLVEMIEHPIEGQEHRVVIIRPPVGNQNIGKAFYRVLAELQEDSPECIIHVHGLYSYRLMFSPWFRSVDFEPRTLAAKGKVTLPTGKEVRYERTFDESHWVTLLGMRPHDLRIPRNRCIFNIKSAMWAAEHFKDAVKIRTKGFTHVDPDDPFKRIAESRSIFTRRVQPRQGDKFLCNVCSLQTACKYFREGAVCIVPESEPVELARFFKSRNSDDIIEGLGTLMAAQSHRLKKALAAEDDVEEGEDFKLSKEVTSIINTMFDRGVKLAKLVDPALAAAGAAKVNTNITQINTSTPQAMVAAIVQEFVNRGIPRESVTPEMLMGVFSAPEELRERAIDVAATERTA
jgi:hypothetical protein